MIMVGESVETSVHLLYKCVLLSQRIGRPPEEITEMSQSGVTPGFGQRIWKMSRQDPYPLPQGALMAARRWYPGSVVGLTDWLVISAEGGEGFPRLLPLRRLTPSPQKPPKNNMPVGHL